MRSSFALLATSLVLVPLTACEKEDLEKFAEINYSQPANCYYLDPDPTGTPHGTSSASHGMYIVYTIDRVVTREAPLDLKKLKFYAGGDKTQTVGTAGYTPQFAKFKDQVVPANSEKVDLGRIVIRVEGEPEELKTARVDLSYDNLDAAGELDPPMFVLPSLDAPSEPEFLGTCTPSNLPS